MPETVSSSATIHADLDIQFAGQTVHHKQVAFQQNKQVAFQQTTQGSLVRITGTIPVALSDFKIDPPSLLAMPVKNEIPVKVDMTWHQQ